MSRHYIRERSPPDHSMDHNHQHRKVPFKGALESSNERSFQELLSDEKYPYTVPRYSTLQDSPSKSNRRNESRTDKSLLDCVREYSFKRTNNDNTSRKRSLSVVKRAPHPSEQYQSHSSFSELDANIQSKQRRFESPSKSTNLDSEKWHQKHNHRSHRSDSVTALGPILSKHMDYSSINNDEYSRFNSPNTVHDRNYEISEKRSLTDDSIHSPYGVDYSPRSSDRSYISRMSSSDLFKAFQSALFNQDISIAAAIAESIVIHGLQYERLYLDLCRHGLVTSAIYLMYHHDFKEYTIRTLNNGYYLARVYGHHSLVENMLQSSFKFDTNLSEALYCCCIIKTPFIDKERELITRWILNEHLEWRSNIYPRKIEKCFSIACNNGYIPVIQEFMDLMKFDAKTYIRNQLRNKHPVRLRLDVWELLSQDTETTSL
jgi:hypothetical protein